MPRKRVLAAQRETPEARALRARVLEELRVPLVTLDEKAELKEAKSAKKFVARVLAGGGDLPTALVELARKGLLNPAPVRDSYPAHAATASRPATPERPAPASKAATTADERIEKRKPRKRRPAGLVGYARITDDDDWE